MSLTYYKSSDPWGVMAHAEGANLVFRGLLNPFRIWKERFSRLFFRRPKTFISSDTVDVYELFTPAAKKVWNKALWLAVRRRPMKVGCVHLFLALTEDSGIKEILSRFGADVHDARALLKNYLVLSPLSAGIEEIKKIPFAAFEESEKLHSPGITPLMLLESLIQTLPADNILQAVFSNLGLTVTKLEVVAVWLSGLNYDFPKDSFAADLLHCCQKIQWLEMHNRIKYRLDVIEQALINSGNNPQSALKMLVTSATNAQKHKLRVVSALN